MCRDADPAGMCPPHTVEDKHIWLILQLFEGFLKRWTFPKAEQTWDIREGRRHLKKRSLDDSQFGKTQYDDCRLRYILLHAHIDTSYQPDIVEVERAIINHFFDQLLLERNCLRRSQVPIVTMRDIHNIPLSRQPLPLPRQSSSDYLSSRLPPNDHASRCHRFPHIVNRYQDQRGSERSSHRQTGSWEEGIESIMRHRAAHCQLAQRIYPPR